jgi:hypothetical protein
MRPGIHRVAIGLFGWALSGGAAWAAPITSAGQLSGLQTTTVTFEDLSALNGQQFGFGAGQPYTGLGLTMGNQVVNTTANMGSNSGGIGVQSATILFGGNTNSQSLTFAGNVRGVGFFVTDPLSTSVRVEAYNASNTLLEFVTFGPATAAQFIGFLRGSADIRRVDILAPHNSGGDASSSRTVIDDVTFGSVVPEPAAGAIVAVAGLGLTRRRHRAASI